MLQEVMEIRPYGADDQDACLSVFDSTLPADRRPDFAAFLKTPEGPFFVMHHNDAAIGCGGYQVSREPGVATLVWGMIRSDLQRQGLGRFLLMYRLREIGKRPEIQRVRVETSPSVAKFFESQGFKVVRAVNDNIELVKKLTVCT
jgi:N-acetylglutamate synthase-like GNAT family acetyltransferase